MENCFLERFFCVCCFAFFRGNVMSECVMMVLEFSLVLVGQRMRRRKNGHFLCLAKTHYPQSFYLKYPNVKHLCYNFSGLTSY